MRSRSVAFIPALLLFSSPALAQSTIEQPGTPSDKVRVDLIWGVKIPMRGFRRISL